MKSRTAIMNDKKTINGERRIHQWITDVRGTEFEAEFNVKLQALRADIAGLSEHYKSKLERLDND